MASAHKLASTDSGILRSWARSPGEAARQGPATPPPPWLHETILLLARVELLPDIRQAVRESGARSGLRSPLGDRFDLVAGRAAPTICEQAPIAPCRKRTNKVGSSHFCGAVRLHAMRHPFAALLVALLLGGLGSSEAYYLPGTYPQEYAKGSTIRGASARG